MLNLKSHTNNFSSVRAKKTNVGLSFIYSQELASYCGDECITKFINLLQDAIYDHYQKILLNFIKMECDFLIEFKLDSINNDDLKQTLMADNLTIEILTKKNILLKENIKVKINITKENILLKSFTLESKPFKFSTNQRQKLLVN